jgi:hypothetical protein
LVKLLLLFEFRQLSGKTTSNRQFPPGKVLGMAAKSGFYEEIIFIALNFY